MSKKSRRTKRLKKKERFNKLKEFADSLNENIPKSEIWFRSFYKHFEHSHDLFNYPLGKYIPDILNKQFRYVIEIDGSYHDLPKQQFKDKRKDVYYKKRGYQVFRIKHGDEEGARKAIRTILRRRGEVGSAYFRITIDNKITSTSAPRTMEISIKSNNRESKISTPKAKLIDQIVNNTPTKKELPKIVILRKHR